MPSKFVLARSSALAVAAACAAVVPTAASAQSAGPLTPGDVLIEEFRFHGPGGADDEYVELYNNTGRAGGTARVIDGDPENDGIGNGLYLQYDDGTNTPVVLDVGAAIPDREHWLITNVGAGGVASYTLAGKTGGDEEWNLNGEDMDPNGSLMLVYDHNGQQTVIDEVGFDGSFFDEGTDLTPVGPLTHDHAFVRRWGPGRPVDTNNNASDFRMVGATTDANLLPNIPELLGAPGPQSYHASPLAATGITRTLLLPGATSSQAPNREFVTIGGKRYMRFRRRIKNVSNELAAVPDSIVTHLRFRNIALSTKNGPYDWGFTSANQAVLRQRDSTASGAYQGVRVENVPSDANGGGINSTSEATITGAGDLNGDGELDPGEHVDVEFLFELSGSGSYVFGYETEVFWYEPA